MKILQLLIFLFSTHAWTAENCSTWSDYQKSFKMSKYKPHRIDALAPHGMFIVIHGLNNTSDSMRPLQNALANLGYSSVAMALKGHRGDVEEMGAIKQEDWTSDLNNLYCVLKKEKVPLYGLGYSLGALLLVLHDKKFEKTVFLSPAFSIKPFLYFFSPLSHLYGSLMIPSRNVKEYRAHSSTSLSMYRALFDLYSSFQWNKLKESILFINPDDELLDSNDLVKSAKKYNIKYVLIRPQNVTTSKLYHHLIVDKASMGKQWEHFLKSLRHFLAK